MTNWSNLLPDILHEIAGKMNFYEDFINFLCVCSSWKSSATATEDLIRQQHLLPSRFAMLMLAESETEEDVEQDCRSFFLLSNGMMRKVKLPEARWQLCLSSHGWLLTTGEEEFSAKLLHPLSRTQIDLPQLYMFHGLYFDQHEWMYYRHFMRRVVFTSPNPNLLSQLDPAFRVIIIWGETLGFCRLGDVSWTRINGKEFGCLCLPSAYLLEWGCNSLLMITREHDGKWSKITSLGDKAVILGFNSPFATNACRGMKPDCMYFTDDHYEPYLDLPDGGGGDVGVYHMFDGSIEAMFDLQESVFRCSPLWLQTNNDQGNLVICKFQQNFRIPYSTPSACTLAPQRMIIVIDYFKIESGVTVMNIQNNFVFGIHQVTKKQRMPLASDCVEGSIKL
ncbi:hypothetical protein L1987_38941 [Smallanthus sonchifolius]|uniref:Uncharacterized protein n=1 Tax=Smallanthus sonchifolius TaxID=185202 RepID=A0ACB9HKE2_9ASTR|nr:hypothetical protein L1987_38941 [Smallanthus sonchifolius]